MRGYESRTGILESTRSDVIGKRSEPGALERFQGQKERLVFLINGIDPHYVPMTTYSHCVRSGGPREKAQGHHRKGPTNLWAFFLPTASMKLPQSIGKTPLILPIQGRKTATYCFHDVKKPLMYPRRYIEVFPFVKIKEQLKICFRSREEVCLAFLRSRD